MALQRTVGVDLRELNQATGPPNRDANESGFSQRANKLDSLGATSGSNVQAIPVPVFKGEEVQPRLQDEFLIFRQAPRGLLMLIRED